MKFLIEELTDNSKSYFEINLDKKCLEVIKQATELQDVKIDFESLNLGVTLYGKTKKESIQIQKANCKKVLQFYKICKKAVKILRKKFDFSGKFYVENLSQKKNNNDIMLVGLCEVDFNTKIFDRMRVAYEYACDFLDAENSLNKMCDFHDNHCTKHRDKGIDKSTGCCPGYCKIRVDGQACQHKNLACKIFMCDYLIYEKGFYFTSHTLPVLKKHMSTLERAICFGTLCRTEKKSLKFLWLIRGISVLYVLLFIGIIATILL